MTPGRTEAGFVVRLACFFAATFLVTGVKGTYLPVWLDWRGLSAPQISAVVALPLLLRIVATPVVGFAADRFGDHRKVVIGLAWLSFVLIVLLVPTAGFWPILVLTLALALSSSSIMPLAETVAMAGLKAGHDYGRMRLWGSVSFIAASFAAGIGVENLGAVSVVPMMAVAALLAMLAAHALPKPPPAAPSDDSPRRRIDLAEVARLLRRPEIAIFLLAVGAIQAAHAVFYTLGVLHWRDQGLSPVTISFLWAIGVVAEIGLFACSRAVVVRVGAVGLILAAGAAAVARWLAMAFDPPLWALMGLQGLHGLTYGAAHLGAVHFLAAAVPREQAGTAQSLYATVAYGILLGIATMASGAVYPILGGKAYLGMAALAAVGLAAGLALRRIGAPRGAD